MFHLSLLIIAIYSIIILLQSFTITPILYIYIGCGILWVTDGIWKLNFPHCMHRVKVKYSCMYMQAIVQCAWYIALGLDMT